MVHAPILSLDLDPQSATPLFAQIYEALRRRIISGEQAANSRLPATRRLAEELAVSRATVVAAYDQLEAEGFVEGRTGSGIYVSAIGSVELPSQPVVTQFEHDFAPTTLQPLQPGRPDMDLFPHRAWAKCFAKVARTEPEALTQFMDAFGDPELRNAIGAYLSEWRGFAVSPERIVITAGTADAVELCVRTITARGGAIAMEDPGYQPLRSLVQSLGLQPSWMSQDSEGAQTPPNAPFAPPITLLTPSSNFPLGGAMSTARRVQFLTWARNNGTWLIEDDYDSEFRYAGRPIPAMAGLDQYGRTFYIGSFSKIFSETLRLGFLVVPEFFVGAVRENLRSYGAKASLSAQRPLSIFMQNGDFHRHIRKMRRIYGERRQILLDLLKTHLNNFGSWTDHHAGMQIVLNLPENVDDVAVSSQAARENVICPPLSTYYAQPQNRSGLLVGFCGFKPDDMQRSALILKEILENHT
ncbi:MAG: PLP-dependent aminotransferase family protein [Magnetovibrio sp.]|nr:PLP-dependent aminotransferase family protein [Magnetovibrio sp.]